MNPERRIREARKQLAIAADSDSLSEPQAQAARHLAGIAQSLADSIEKQREDPELIPDGGRSTSDIAESRLPTPIPSAGDDDAAILLNGMPLEARDAGGTDDGGYVICEATTGARQLDVVVSYDVERGWFRGVKIADCGSSDTGQYLTTDESQPDVGLRYTGEIEGETVTVEILPEQEVDRDV